MSSTERGTTVEEAICVMNAYVTATEHIETVKFENQRNLLSKDGTIVKPDTLLTSRSLLKTHTAHNGRTVLENFIMESVQASSKARGAILILSKIFLNVVKSGYICKASILTLKNLIQRLKILCRIVV